MSFRISPRCLLVTLALMSTGAAQEEPDLSQLGHSLHGDEFDEGPRERPWGMEGIGASTFPVTSASPDVQAWFDQGHTLLHSFWYYEAERAFRWCIKLDPDCAMAWWGLSRATGGRRGGGGDRSAKALREAVLRKATVTERERMYIEAWEHAFAPELSGDDADSGERGRGRLADELERIVLAYPDDIEAKALFLLYSLYTSSRYGNELITREILSTAPEHPGAHHYAIHNWDGPEGEQALASSAVYGRVAWNVGHANHMPGHIYSGIGMWHEGAIWMDSATRVEKAYMQRRMIYPFNNWNYAHNRNYLSYIQEQLGMPALAIDGGRQLLAAPFDPKYNDPDGSGRTVFGQGVIALWRGLVKFERWHELLGEETIPGRDDKDDHAWKQAYAEALAHHHLGHRQETIDALAELERLADEARGSKKSAPSEIRRYRDEVKALVVYREGDRLEAIRLLADVAKRQHDAFERENDPPRHPRFLYRVLGELYLDIGAPMLAVESFEKTLERVRNDAFSLSGLARAHHALGDVEGAREALGRLLHVWSGADPDLRWLRDATSLGLQAEPLATTAAPERRYVDEPLATLGPDVWRPYPAPRLEASDSSGSIVTLGDYRGQNVLLVFYLGEECPHCVDQLQAIHKRRAEFASRDVALLGISSDSPSQNAKSEQMGELAFRLLSDVDHDNARRFHSYDEFEEMELHSTILIDRAGDMRWSRHGGDPFMELDFLLGEIDRANEEQEIAAVAPPSSGGGASGSR